MECLILHNDRVCVSTETSIPKCCGYASVEVKFVYMHSVPSILRNSRYRRDQRQLDEEEELWFNEEEEFDEGEAVVPAAAATADLVSPASTKKQSSSSNSTLSPALTDSKSHQQQQQQQQQQSVLNNNTSNNNITSQQPQINNSSSTTNESPITSDITPNSAIGTVEKTGTALFKKVREKVTCTRSVPIVYCQFYNMSLRQMVLKLH